MIYLNNTKRRNFLITITTLLYSSILPKKLLASDAVSLTFDNKKSLILYFSHSGNTRYLANEIHKIIGGTLFELKTTQPYPQDHDTVVDLAKKEQKENFRPKLAEIPADLGSYDIVFIGFPNWWETIPMAFFTFFEENRLDGKTLIPFITHEGSYFGRSILDLEKLNPKANLLKGLSIRGRSVRSSSTQKELISWLTNLKKTIKSS